MKLLRPIRLFATLGLIATALAMRFCSVAASTWDSTNSPPQYISRSWQRDDGLPQNSAEVVAQTTDGYLRVSGRRGLARFNGAGEVQLQIEFADGAFRIQVRDNGRGFRASEALARGRGLENMRARLESLPGRWDLQTQPGQGTAITIEFNVAGSGLSPRAAKS